MAFIAREPRAHRRGLYYLMSNEKNDYFEDFLRNEILHFDADKVSTGKADAEKADVDKLETENTAAEEKSETASDSLRRKPVENETIAAKKKEAMLSRVADVLGDITSPKEKNDKENSKENNKEASKENDKENSIENSRV